MKSKTAVSEITSLANFLYGLAAAFQFAGYADTADSLTKAAGWLEQTADHVCGAGCWCEGGEGCTSDHK